MVAMATAPDVNATATVMPPSFGVMKPPTEQVVAAENMKIRSVIDSVANDWLCPLTHELPFDPVTAEDGHIYERAAIERVLQRGNGLSPLTREPLRADVLVPNRALKRRIDEHEEDVLRVAATAADMARLRTQRSRGTHHSQNWHRVAPP